MDFRAYLDTGNVAASLAIHLDDSGSATTTLTPTQNGLGTFSASLEAMVAWMRLQVRLTVSTLAFRWEGFGTAYKALPIPFVGRTPEWNGDYPGEKVIGGYQIRVCTMAAARTFTPYIDGVAQSTFAITSATDEPVTYTYDLAATATGTDFSLAVDGDIELYDWQPVVLYKLPQKLKIWENKPLVPSQVRRRFGGFNVQIDTQSAAATITPVLDGVAQSTLAVTTADLLGATLTFSSLVGRDLWCKVTSATAFRPYSVEPIVLETLPQKFKGRVADQNAGVDSEKALAGLKIHCCTLNAARAFTAILDGVSQAPISATTGPDEADTVIIQFPSTARPPIATDIGWSVDGDIELYDWTPLVLYTLPVRIKTYENKPLVPSPTRRRFTGLALHLDAFGGTVTCTPVVAGVDQTPQTLSNSDLLSTVILENAVVGRDLWCRLTSTTPFSPLSIQPIIVETLPQQMQGTTPRTQVGYVGVKTIAGYQLRLCTLGVPTTITTYIDGIAQPNTFTVTSDKNEPIDYTAAIVMPAEGVEFSVSTDKPVEWYHWTPIVTARRPLGVLAWDSGPLDVGDKDLVWLRKILIKVRAGADLQVVTFFDGNGSPGVTYPIATPNVDTILTIPFGRPAAGRAYVGRLPRIVITSTARFYPYWMKLVRRTSGLGTDKPAVEMPITLDVGMGG